MSADTEWLPLPRAIKCSKIGTLWRFLGTLTVMSCLAARYICLRYSTCDWFLWIWCVFYGRSSVIRGRQLPRFSSRLAMESSTSSCAPISSIDTTGGRELNPKTHQIGGVLTMALSVTFQRVVTRLEIKSWWQRLLLSSECSNVVGFGDFFPKIMAPAYLAFFPLIYRGETGWVYLVHAMWASKIVFLPTKFTANFAVTRCSSLLPREQEAPETLFHNLSQLILNIHRNHIDNLVKRGHPRRSKHQLSLVQDWFSFLLLGSFRGIPDTLSLYYCHHSPRFPLVLKCCNG